MKAQVRTGWWGAVVVALMLSGCLNDGGGGSPVPVGDTAAPQVSNSTPSNAATGVPVNSAVSVTFSEAMAPGTITSAGFRLEKTGSGPTNAIAGAVIYLGTTATFTPTANLDFASTYTATLTTAAQDLAGNTLAVNSVWSFTTGPAPDTIVNNAG